MQNTTGQLFVVGLSPQVSQASGIGIPLVAPKDTCDVMAVGPNLHAPFRSVSLPLAPPMLPRAAAVALHKK